MKKSLATLGLLLAVLLPAGAALATVEDQAGILTPDAKASLESQLGNYGSHRFDVVFVDHVDGTVESLAQVKFQQHHLDKDDGLIAVAVKDKKVAVHLGGGFQSHGVGTLQIKSHLRSDFFPQAKAGHFDTASAQLARGLMSETHTTSTQVVQQPRQVAPPVQHGGFPWGIFLFLGLAGGGIWWFMRNRNKVNLEPRVKTLKDQHAQIVAQALRLDDVDTLGRFREGDMAAQYKKLGRKSADLMAESRDFGEKLIEVEALAKKGKKEAEPMLQQLEGRSTGLQSEVAAALTTLDRLEGTSGLTGKEEDLPKLVSRLSRRYQELKDAYDELKRRAPSGYTTDSTVERRLEEAQRLLTTVPVDAKEAEDVILEATDALEAYRRKIDGEQDREAIRQGEYQGGWAQSAGYLPYMALPATYHRPYFYTSYYEEPVVVVHHDVGGGSWGSDAGGSWGDNSSAVDDRRDTSGSDASGGWGDSSSSSSDSGGGGDWGGGGDSGGGGGDW
ncbi:MAG: hypothetical protein JWM80_4247 [Cyanobacteria bacterium RYN_339]|nr:hypothetical protein [Cyanobacteria bacterium RYN_339]